MHICAKLVCYKNKCVLIFFDLLQQQSVCIYVPYTYTTKAKGYRFVRFTVTTTSVCIFAPNMFVTKASLCRSIRSTIKTKCQYIMQQSVLMFAPYTYTNTTKSNVCRFIRSTVTLQCVHVHVCLHHTRIQDKTSVYRVIQSQANCYNTGLLSGPS